MRRTFHDDDDGSYGPPRSGKQRTVPLPADAAAVLAERGRSDALVFGELCRGLTDAPFVRATFGDNLCRAAVAAGLSKRLHPHSTRHTWASHAVIAGIPSRVIMAWAGWQSERMLGRYVHLGAGQSDHYAQLLTGGGVNSGVAAAVLRVVRGAKGA